MYSLGVITGGAAVLVTYVSPSGALTIAAIGVAATLAGVALLERAPCTSHRNANNLQLGLPLNHSRFNFESLPYLGVTSVKSFRPAV